MRHLKIRKTVERLAEDEERRAGSLEDFIAGRKRKAETPEEKAQLSLLLEDHEQLRSIRGKPGQWGSLTLKVPLLQLLLHHPVVFVDFGAWNESDFIRSYGVTAQQMAILAEEDFVIPSLYSYDSYRDAVERNPNDIHGYERDECQHLDALFEFDEPARCRIASIRRRALFRSIGIHEENDKKKKSSTEKWEHIFKPAAEKLGNEVLKNVIGRDNIEDTVHKLCTNFEYVKKLGASEPEVMEFCNQVETRRHFKFDELVKEMRVLNGLKTRLASPLTAAYGGIYNMNPANYRNVNQSSIVLPIGENELSEQDMFPIEYDYYCAGIEALTRLALRNDVVDDKDIRSFQFSSPPGDAEFRSFVSWLKEHESLREKVTLAIEAVCECSTNEQLLTAWTNYLGVIKRVEKSVAREKTLARSVVPTAIGGAVGFAAGIVLGPGLNLPDALLLAGVGLGAILVEGHLQRRMKSSPKWRLVARLEDLQLAR